MCNYAFCVLSYIEVCSTEFSGTYFQVDMHRLKAITKSFSLAILFISLLHADHWTVQGNASLPGVL